MTVAGTKLGISSAVLCYQYCVTECWQILELDLRNPPPPPKKTLFHPAQGRACQPTCVVHPLIIVIRISAKESLGLEFARLQLPNAVAEESFHHLNSSLFVKSDSVPPSFALGRWRGLPSRSGLAPVMSIGPACERRGFGPNIQRRPCITRQPSVSNPQTNHQPFSR
ncbi:hypothetical protein LX36DRAFT_19603 [Colletotrichum falcatum]|nr:hypothetical protein LX36DRAFT_19603 [Colletotrichum falcatum]